MNELSPLLRLAPRGPKTNRYGFDALAHIQRRVNTQPQQPRSPSWPCRGDPLTALAVGGCGGGASNDATGPRARRRRRTERRRRSASRTAASARSSSTRRVARCTCSRGLGNQERLLRRVRRRLAAAAGERQADGRHRADGLQARNDDALRRQAAGDLQRPPALSFAGDHNPGDTNGQGLTRSAAVVRPVPRRQPGLRQGHGSSGGTLSTSVPARPADRAATSCRPRPTRSGPRARGRGRGARPAVRLALPRGALDRPAVPRQRGRFVVVIAGLAYRRTRGSPRLRG